IGQVTPPGVLKSVTVVLRLAPNPQPYGDLIFSTQPGVDLIVVGGGYEGFLKTYSKPEVKGASPAVVVTGGNVELANLKFTTDTDAPTIVVSGGNLTVRDSIVEESTGFSDAAIAVSGGSTVDLGTPDSPGGNTINVTGTGRALLSTGTNVILAA